MVLSLGACVQVAGIEEALLGEGALEVVEVALVTIAPL